MHEVIVIGDEVVELALFDPAGVRELEIEDIAGLELCVHFKWLVDVLAVFRGFRTPPLIAENDQDKEQRECNCHGDISASPAYRRRFRAGRELRFARGRSYDAHQPHEKNNAEDDQDDAKSALHLTRAHGGGGYGDGEDSGPL